MRCLRALLLLTLLATPARAQVVINELMASNQRTVADPDFGDYSDWLELHNAGTLPADLGGYFLTDDLEEHDKWRVPDGTVLAPGAYLVIWADDRDEGLHTSFKLSANGEEVGLFTPAGQPVDALTFGSQTTDVSYGRSPDGGTALRFFAVPTPGSANDTVPADGVAEPPAVSLQTGVYAGPQTVTMSTALPGATIRYTLNGRPPTDTSAVYEAPLTFAETGVLRTAVFRSDVVPSTVVTATYLINEAPTLPIVSLVTDPAHFFSDDTGIYVDGASGPARSCWDERVNWNQDWERPVHATLIEPDGRVGFALDLGVKIHGGCSRTQPQKSLALYARRQYGPSKIDYQVFPDQPGDEFESLVLRNSGQDWRSTMMRDGVAQAAAGGDLDQQAYRPTVVFINGAYWGLHNLREKLNEHYVEAHHGVDHDDVELVEAGGSDPRTRSEHYDALLAYLEVNDVVAPEHYAYVQTQIDTEAYLDYVIAEIYSANADWPSNNVKQWRPRTPDGRWRWMFYDLDFGFGGSPNGQFDSNTLAQATAPDGPSWPNPPWATYLLRRLLGNADFRATFIQRMAARISTTYAPERGVGLIDSLQAHIADEIPRHKARWPGSVALGPSWDSQVEVLRRFARKRPEAMRGHVTAHFGLAGTTHLDLDAGAGGGQVYAAGVPLPRGASAPVFFRDVPLQLVAVPDQGYVFKGWQGLVTSTEDTLSVTLVESATLTATFARDTASPEQARPSARPTLSQNYPNPFRDRTQIEIEHAVAGPLTVTVFDLLGRQVATLVDEVRPAGTHSFDYDAAELRSGVYVYVMEAEGFRAARHMVVVR
ncbi:MAG: CotH kinase family protein [Bacteroidota bacterium]